MTKQDVINNIMVNYRNHGVSLEWLEEMIHSGEEQGFSYQTIYTGLRMALGSNTEEQELFTVSEIAEAMGATEEEILQEIERLKAEMEEAGEDTEKHFKQNGPMQQFIIPPGGFTS